MRMRVWLRSFDGVYGAVGLDDFVDVTVRKDATFDDIFYVAAEKVTREYRLIPRHLWRPHDLEYAPRLMLRLDGSGEYLDDPHNWADSSACLES